MDFECPSMSVLGHAGELSTFNTLSQYSWDLTLRTLPVNVVLNHLLTSCVFGLPVEEGLLKILTKGIVFPFCLFYYSNICLLVIGLIRFYLSSLGQWPKQSPLSVPILTNLELYKTTYKIQGCNQAVSRDGI